MKHQQLAVVAAADIAVVDIGEVVAAAVDSWLQFDQNRRTSSPVEFCCHYSQNFADSVETVAEIAEIAEIEIGYF